MNQKDKDFVSGVLARNQHPSATAATWDAQSGYKSNHTEAARLMDSADYKAGWLACFE